MISIKILENRDLVQIFFSMNEPLKGERTIWPIISIFVI